MHSANHSYHFVASPATPAESFLKGSTQVYEFKTASSCDCSSTKSAMRSFGYLYLGSRLLGQVRQ